MRTPDCSQITQKLEAIQDGLRVLRSNCEKYMNVSRGERGELADLIDTQRRQMRVDLERCRKLYGPPAVFESCGKRFDLHIGYYSGREIVGKIERKYNKPIGEITRDALWNIKHEKESRNIHLVIYSLRELGLSFDYTFEEIITRATELGLSLCPPEVGGYLTLENSALASGETAVVAMRPITKSKVLFYVQHDKSDNPFLITMQANMMDFFPYDITFVFVDREK